MHEDVGDILGPQTTRLGVQAVGREVLDVKACDASIVTALQSVARREAAYLVPLAQGIDAGLQFVALALLIARRIAPLLNGVWAAQVDMIGSAGQSAKASAG